MALLPLVTSEFKVFAPFDGFHGYILFLIVTSRWCSNGFWAFVFTFMQVSVMWALNLVASEIENPFGRDSNDIDGKRMQEELNRHLLLLLKPSTERTPRLSQLFDDSELSAWDRSGSLARVLRSER